MKIQVKTTREPLISTFTGLPADNPSEFSQSWANFLLGRVSLFTQDQHDLLADIHQNQFELYAQDEYRIRPNLTLSYGLRYSLFRQPTDGKGRLTNFDPSRYDPAKAPVIDPSPATLFPVAIPTTIRSMASSSADRIPLTELRFRVRTT